MRRWLLGAEFGSHGRVLADIRRLSRGADPKRGPFRGTLPTPSKGPATATFTLAGTKGLTAPVTANEIVCNRPSLDGPTIFLLGTSGTAGPQVILFVRAGYVEVRVGTGSATTLHLRSFEGSGVTGFDGATGVQLDSTLKETTPAGTDKGDLGVVTSIKGTLDCGNEGLGSSTIAITAGRGADRVRGRHGGQHRNVAGPPASARPEPRRCS